MANPIKMDDLGVPLFSETPMYVKFLGGIGGAFNQQDLKSMRVCQILDSHFSPKIGVKIKQNIFETTTCTKNLVPKTCRKNWKTTASRLKYSPTGVPEPLNNWLAYIHPSWLSTAYKSRDDPPSMDPLCKNFTGFHPRFHHPNFTTPVDKCQHQDHEQRR